MFRLVSLLILYLAGLAPAQATRPTPAELLARFDAARPITLTGTQSPAVRLTTGIDDAIRDAADPATARALFSVRDPANKRYEWNKENWAIRAGVDVTCLPVAVRNAIGDFVPRGATLIAPELVLSSQHWPLEVGYKVYFLTANNVLHERTVVGFAPVPDRKWPPGWHDWTDYRICRLNRPLPGTVKPVELAAMNWWEILPNGGNGVPVAFVGQHMTQLCVGVVKRDPARHSMLVDPPQDAIRAPWYAKPIDGDSGQPILFVDGAKLRLPALFGGSGGGENLGWAHDDVMSLSRQFKQGIALPTVAEMGPGAATVVWGGGER